MNESQGAALLKWMHAAGPPHAPFEPATINSGWPTCDHRLNVAPMRQKQHERCRLRPHLSWVVFRASPPSSADSGVSGLEASTSSLRESGKNFYAKSPQIQNYLIVTVAPAAVSSALTLSASSFETPVFTVFGAPSTKSLASFRPRPVMVRMTLMTSSFFSP